MENKNKLIISGIIILSFVMLYWSFSASIKGSQIEVKDGSAQASISPSRLSDKPISEVSEHSEESFEKALESQIEEDPCASPEGYTDEAWKEHMSHHPDRYKDCFVQNSDLKSSTTTMTTPAKISQADMGPLIQSESDFLLIDVRTEAEYDNGHLPGAIVIPYDEFETRYVELLDYKDKEIILYCHTGGMGDYAGKVLLQKGFTNVKNLDGGISGWIKSGGQIVV